MAYNGPAIVAEGIEKHFGATHALRGLDLHVEEGIIFGVLGPNGAGKTTSVRILTTLLQPDKGRAMVAGIDVAKEPAKVRRQIGLAGQYAAVDELLTGWENLEMVGRLYGLSSRDAKRRADELLQRFALEDAAKRLVKTYSGGMRRRLDLAASLIVAPPVLFLDEPTTGLDPRSRAQMWEVIRDLVADGATVLLTTQYLEEADQLAQRIAVIDDGQVIALGTPDELKARVGGARLEATLAHERDVEPAIRVFRVHGGDAVHVDRERRRVSLPVSDGAGLAAAIIRDLETEGVRFDDLGLHRPSLDDVFLTLTGHIAGEETENGAATSGKGKGKQKQQMERVA